MKQGEIFTGTLGDFSFLQEKELHKWVVPEELEEGRNTPSQKGIGKVSTDILKIKFLLETAFVNCMHFIRNER